MTDEFGGTRSPGYCSAADRVPMLVSPRRPKSGIMRAPREKVANAFSYLHNRAWIRSVKEWSDRR